IPGVFVEKVDNDAAGVIVTQSGDDSVVFEGGATDTISVGLSHAPAAGSVMVTLTSSDGQIRFNGLSSLTLNLLSTTAQTVTISTVPRGGLVTRVLVDGIRLDRSQFSLSSNVVTISAPLRAGANVAITYQGESSATQVLVGASPGSFAASLDLTFTTSNWN